MMRAPFAKRRKLSSSGQAPAQRRQDHLAQKGFTHTENDRNHVQRQPQQKKDDGIPRSSIASGGKQTNSRTVNGHAGIKANVARQASDGQRRDDASHVTKSAKPGAQTIHPDPGHSNPLGNAPLKKTMGQLPKNPGGPIRQAFDDIPLPPSSTRGEGKEPDLPPTPKRRDKRPKPSASQDSPHGSTAKKDGPSKPVQDRPKLQQARLVKTGKLSCLDLGRSISWSELTEYGKNDRQQLDMEWRSRNLKLRIHSLQDKFAFDAFHSLEYDPTTMPKDHAQWTLSMRDLVEQYRRINDPALEAHRNDPVPMAIRARLSSLMPFRESSQAFFRDGFQRKHDKHSFLGNLKTSLFLDQGQIRIEHDIQLNVPCRNQLTRTLSAHCILDPYTQSVQVLKAWDKSTILDDVVAWVNHTPGTTFFALAKVLIQMMAMMEMMRDRRDYRHEMQARYPNLYCEEEEERSADEIDRQGFIFALPPVKLHVRWNIAIDEQGNVNQQLTSSTTVPDSWLALEGGKDLEGLDQAAPILQQEYGMQGAIERLVMALFPP